MAFPIRIGTAGWAIPRTVRDAFPEAGSGLQRYAARFPAVEINTSFYRPHRRATYERWAASVPEDFRFAVKLPKAITHEARLVGGEQRLAQFAEEIAGLGAKRGPVLVQLPPSLAFDAAIATAFFDLLNDRVGSPIVCEPRHPSWFESEANTLLATHRIARVAADPAPVPAAGEAGGWRGLAYFRLHGSPQIYRSSYDADALARWSALAGGHPEAWVIFDNTTTGAAAANALALADIVKGPATTTPPGRGLT